MGAVTFFDTYARFYETSKTGPWRNRLNQRYRALIESNQEILRGASILDLASHDGRWSFAALKHGAARVIGIEGREELVRNARESMEAYGISRDRFHFILGDVFREVDDLERGSFDVVFCFGFFYHTMHHVLLLSKIQRLASRYLLLDTGIGTSKETVVELREEDATEEPNAIPTEGGASDRVLVGYPSKGALELMLRHFGYEWSYYDWQGAGITSWEHLEDYRDGHRVSIVAKNVGRKGGP